MKSKVLLFILLTSTLLNYVSSQTVTDYDGNVYQTVTIGDQIWMGENLKVTHYGDGTPLVNGTGVGELEEIDTTRFFFYYNDDTSNVENYGCLYTWYTAVNQVSGSNSIPSGVQGVCPNGWHIPSDREWQELAISLSMDTSIAQNPFGIDINNTIGDLLKENGSSGFEAKFAGVRDLWGGEFGGIGIMSDFISATGFKHIADDPYVTSIISYYIMINTPNLYSHSHNTNAGYSVRCIKDSSITGIPESINNSNHLVIFPNPFSLSSTIQFTIPKTEHVSLQIFNSYAQQVAILVDEIKIEGKHKITWQPEGLPRGIYFCKLHTDKFSETRKLILQK